MCAFAMPECQVQADSPAPCGPWLSRRSRDTQAPFICFLLCLSKPYSAAANSNRRVHRQMQPPRAPRHAPRTESSEASFSPSLGDGVMAARTQRNPILRVQRDLYLPGLGRERAPVGFAMHVCSCRRRGKGPSCVCEGAEQFCSPMVRGGCTPRGEKRCLSRRAPKTQRFGFKALCAYPSFTHLCPQ